MNKLYENSNFDILFFNFLIINIKNKMEVLRNKIKNFRTILYANKENKVIKFK